MLTVNSKQKINSLTSKFKVKILKTLTLLKKKKINFNL